MNERTRRKRKENGEKGKQSEKLLGNQNARTSDNGSKVIRLRGADVDLLVNFFATEGNLIPTSTDFSHAIHYAIVQVYRRKIEHDQANIL